MHLITAKQNALLIATAFNNLADKGVSIPDILHLQVRLSDHLEPNAYEEIWEPPFDRFIEYEASDEQWCRPLGIGKVVRRDMGPVFYIVSDSDMDWSFRNKLPAFHMTLTPFNLSMMSLVVNSV